MKSEKIINKIEKNQNVHVVSIHTASAPVKPLKNRPSGVIFKVEGLSSLVATYRRVIKLFLFCGNINRFRSVFYHLDV